MEKNTQAADQPVLAHIQQLVEEEHRLFEQGEHGPKVATDNRGGTVMNWEAPSFVEVKMDAEINSYQDDFRGTPDTQEPSAEAPVVPAPQ